MSDIEEKAKEIVGKQEEIQVIIIIIIIIIIIL